MSVRSSLPNTAKRFADQLSVMSDLETELPTSASRLAEALGRSYSRHVLANTAKRIADSFGLGGGPSAPSWVEALRSPTGDLPILAAEMANVPPHYWFNGAECAVTDIFEENLDWASYSPADIVSGVGLTGGGSGPVFTAAVFSVLGDNGFTAVHSSTWNGVSGEGYNYWQFTEFTYKSSRSDFAWIGTTVGEDVEATRGLQLLFFNRDGAIPDQNSYSEDKIAPVAGTLKVANTWNYDTHMAGSFNGRPVFTADFLPTVSPEYTVLGLWIQDLPIRDFYIYPPQPEADLPALSTL